MSDDDTATPTEAVEETAIRTDEPSPQESQSQAAPTSDLFVGKDFEDPYWGKKAKNLQRLHEKGVADRKGAERERDDYQEKFGKIKQFWDSHPKLAAQAKAELEREAAGITTDTSDDDSPEPTENEKLRREVERLEQKVDGMGQTFSHNDAMTPVYSELGGGDIEKGRRLYESEGWSEDMTHTAEVWNKGKSDRDAVRQLFDYTRLKRKSQQPPTPEVRETSGTARADTERGSSAPMPTVTGGNSREDAIKDAMKNLGVSSTAEWAAVTAEDDDGEV